MGQPLYLGATHLPITADTILANFFCENVGFTTTSSGLPGVSRSYNNFAAAADEAGISRIYGGIHFLYKSLAIRVQPKKQTS